MAQVIAAATPPIWMAMRAGSRSADRWFASASRRTHAMTATASTAWARSRARQICWMMVRPNPVAFAMPRLPRMRLAVRRRFQRPHNHLLDLLITDLTRRPGPRLVAEPVQSLTNEAAAPFAHGGLRVAQPRRDGLVVVPLGTRENAPRTPRHVWSCRRSMGHARYFTFFAVRTLAAAAYRAPIRIGAGFFRMTMVLIPIWLGTVRHRT